MYFVDVVFGPPGNIVAPHLLRLLQFELPRPQEPQQIHLVPTRVQAASVESCDNGSELIEGLQLIWGAVSGEAGYGKRYPVYLCLSLFMCKINLNKYYHVLPRLES